MKKSLVYLLLSGMVLTSCGNSQARSDKDKGAAMGKESSVSTESSGSSGAFVGEALKTEAAVTAKPTDAVGGGTVLLNKATFLAKVWNYEKSPSEWVFLGDKPAVIDFYADWCGPCRVASPILEEVSRDFAGKIHVYKIDTQKEEELAAVFGIRSIPAFLYIPKNGKPTMMAGIGRSKEETKKMFVDNINKLLLQEP